MCPPYCGDLAHSFLRLLGVVFVNGELGNPVPSWPSVCCTKHMRLLQRHKGLASAGLLGVIGKKPGGYAGFVEGVMSGVRHCIEKKLCNSGHDPPTRITTCK